MATRKPRQHYATHTRSVGITASQREAVALAHGLAEARAYLLTRCAASPQARRLAVVCEHAIDRILPREPRGLYGDADDDE
jgi:hypothetical protein